MLVSFMSMCNAISMKNHAMMGMFNTGHSMMGMMSNPNLQNSNMNLLHQLDTQNSLNMAKYQMMYQMASALEKQSKKMLEDNLEQDKKLNYFA